MVKTNNFKDHPGPVGPIYLLVQLLGLQGQNLLLVTVRTVGLRIAVTWLKLASVLMTWEVATKDLKWVMVRFRDRGCQGRQSQKTVIC